MKKRISLLLVSLVSCVFFACSYHVPEEDSGYFLTWGQKYDLFTRGRLMDAQKNEYDVFLCPGYAAPVRTLGESFEGAAKCFKWYASDLWWDVAKNMYECAWDDCLVKSYDATTHAWKDNFNTASTAVEKRVFGWAMAYPTALGKSFLQTCFYVPWGIVSSTVVASAATVFPPTVYVAGPLVCAPAYVCGGVTALAGGYAWNTIVTPPAALFGERPTPETIDNDYIKIISPDANAVNALQTMQNFIANEKFSDKEDVQDFAQNFLTQKTKINARYAKKMRQNRKQENKAVRKIMTDMADHAANNPRVRKCYTELEQKSSRWPSYYDGAFTLENDVYNDFFWRLFIEKLAELKNNQSLDY